MITTSRGTTASWTFDQIQTLFVGSGSGRIEIDKNIVSGRDNGIGSVLAPLRTTADPQIPGSRLDAFEADWFRECDEHEDSIPQQAVMGGNRWNVKSRVVAHDAYITQLASSLNVPKALIMTPLIWEGMVINGGDAIADGRVHTYYTALETTGATLPGLADDSSTGVCQMFARTGIRAHNWARSKGLTSAPTYNASNWQDVWAMWKLIRDDEQAAIRLAAWNMMAEAVEGANAQITQLRTLTPSQVMAMCVGYNDSWFDGPGPGSDGMVYGRNRYMLYWTIHRWHQTF